LNLTGINFVQAGKVTAADFFRPTVQIFQRIPKPLIISLGQPIQKLLKMRRDARVLLMVWLPYCSVADV
jgi:hypothetical protein